MTTPAVFLDRDGTLVEARHYPSKPEDLVIYDGMTSELRRLRGHGFKLVLITNQSGIARGFFTESDLDRMHDSLRAELRQTGVEIDAIYFCPHHVDGVVPELAIRCDCRKPAPGMLLRAANELDIDLQRSWFVGDILDDIEAGNRAGCRTVLVDLGTESPPTHPLRRPHFVAPSAVHALRLIRSVERDDSRSHVQVDYLPEGWKAEDCRRLTPNMTGASHGSS